MELAVGGWFLPLPRAFVRYLTAKEAARWARRRSKLTPVQRRLHGVVVRELPGAGGPLTPEHVAEASGEDLQQVKDALGDLHTWLGFVAAPWTTSCWRLPSHFLVAATRMLTLFEATFMGLRAGSPDLMCLAPYMHMWAMPNSTSSLRHVVHSD